MTTQTQSWHDQKLKIAFVPTMGCLHSGHLSLVKKATEMADKVIVSIFVNPLQFNDPGDLANYPRTLEDDLESLSDYKVDLVFAPDVDGFYPEGEERVEKITPGNIATVLEGAHRPGHFEGVATVVKRLFDIVTPGIAIFGEKDFQQLLVIKQLVEKTGSGIEVVGMPTLREADGLAMSSRNRLLPEKDRALASLLYQQLVTIRDQLKQGNLAFQALQYEAAKQLNNKGFSVEYIRICDANSLEDAVPGESDNMVILLAAKLGEIRLIDNIRV